MTGVFATIRRGCKWFCNYWYIPLVALGSVATFLLMYRRETPIEAVADEIKTIKRAQRLERMAVEHKAEIANALADDQYRSILLRLDEKQRAKADELRRNPGKRLLYLRRIAKRLGRR